jgi:hypothetical protein
VPISKTDCQEHASHRQDNGKGFTGLTATLAFVDRRYNASVSGRRRSRFLIVANIYIYRRTVG